MYSFSAVLADLVAFFVSGTTSTPSPARGERVSCWGCRTVRTARAHWPESTSPAVTGRRRCQTMKRETHDYDSGLPGWTFSKPAGP